jgi:hypothetical protein
MRAHNFKVSIPLGIIIMITSIIYQRTTGPTYPKRVTIVHEDTKYKAKLLRSHGGETDAPIELPLIKGASATITYKRYPTNDEWSTKSFEPKGDKLVATLPHQPPAGKHTYFVEINLGAEKKVIGSKEDPIYIRFKGDVPSYILGPHIFFMFLSMLFSAIALFEALMKTNMYYRLTQLTTGSLLIGGMILGPIVQKFAFGVYWAGFPYDNDLTDNKLLVGVLVWVIALALNYKKRTWQATVFASIVLLIVYSIPHSMQGSQYDYEKGKVITTEDH